MCGDSLIEKQDLFQSQVSGANPTSPLHCCYQKVMRDKYASIETAPTDICGLRNSMVKEVTISFAKPYILKYEYLGKLSGFSRYAFGHFFNNNCGGVCILGDTSGSNLAFKKILPDKKIIVLQRGVNLWWTPKNSASFFISKVIKWLKKNTDFSAITATCDEEAKEIGTIYQSLGWKYLGSPKHGHPVFIIDGENIHPKTLYDKHGTSSVSKIKEIYGDRLKIKDRIFKHRYIKIFNGRDEITSLLYPKRSKETISEICY